MTQCICIICNAVNCIYFHLHYVLSLFIYFYFKYILGERNLQIKNFIAQFKLCFHCVYDNKLSCILYVCTCCGRCQGVRGVVGLATCWLHSQAIYGLPPINEAGLRPLR